ncbi:streptolysin associated protein SagC [Clostridium tarantellae]|uniref:Streptolysin associated protein SagC n=1 Tax=Clostridium tarantellae TaxID=39493 RepID=A0A6I1MMU4_9CLOT|nr:streptolysin associated protein SagC [Clostridium tarantellae]MPQ43788.1 streptolysin associated protein SagC [Clostridium tarantellae]
MDLSKDYILNNNLRIIDNGTNEIRFRKGLWNYNEAVLDLNEESEGFKSALRNLIHKLKNGGSIKLNSLEQFNLNSKEKENLINIFSALYQAGMICSKDEKDINDELDKVLLGDLRHALIKEDEIQGKKLLLISDNEYCKKNINELSKAMNVELEICSDEFINNIIKKDVTSALDRLETKSNLEGLKEELSKYSAVLMCMAHLNVNVFRNVNRALIELQKQAVVSFIDGPFITMLSINPPKTGCLECFEQRILARMEDHVSYHKFVESKDKTKIQIHDSIVPLLNTMTNLLISEGYMINNFNTCKFEGRVLSMFVPTLEIQVQDLLRVPYCSACGNVAKAQLEEINISTRNVINNIIDNINS